jgi:hypothetical protein
VELTNLRDNLAQPLIVDQLTRISNGSPQCDGPFHDKTGKINGTAHPLELVVIDGCQAKSRTVLAFLLSQDAPKLPQAVPTAFLSGLACQHGRPPESSTVAVTHVG